MLEEVGGGAQGAGSRGVVGEPPRVGDDRHPKSLGGGTINGPLHPFGELPDEFAGGAARRVKD